ncbi:hypothetical protein EB796_022076 [Bugula neritina]|uniref:Uncharacterized protein n=1 Tax=Bugula neritina TaxID=10212 RepID=A0A7J7J0G0_BUGNE|nr:hypothetical protein EB796_022076 [Bugula neritina]
MTQPARHQLPSNHMMPNVTQPLHHVPGSASVTNSAMTRLQTNLYATQSLQFPSAEMKNPSKYLKYSMPDFELPQDAMAAFNGSNNLQNTRPNSNKLATLLESDSSNGVLKKSFPMDFT